jgi:hypothetical protein
MLLKVSIGVRVVTWPLGIRGFILCGRRQGQRAEVEQIV